ncbi:MAG: STAS domain-containing protein [Kangiellaceae bacterium]
MMYRTIEKVEQVKFVDDFSSNEALKIEDEMIFIINRGFGRLVIDISEISSIGRKALKLLERCAELARSKNGWLVLINPSSKIRSLIRSNYSEKTIPIHLSIQSAINSQGI